LGNRSIKIRDVLKTDYKIPQHQIEIILGHGVKNKEKITTEKEPQKENKETSAQNEARGPSNRGGRKKK